MNQLMDDPHSKEWMHLQKKLQLSSGWGKLSVLCRRSCQVFGVLLVSDCGWVISGQIFASRSSSEISEQSWSFRNRLRGLNHHEQWQKTWVVWVLKINILWITPNLGILIIQPGFILECFFLCFFLLQTLVFQDKDPRVVHFPEVLTLRIRESMWDSLVTWRFRMASVVDWSWSQHWFKRVVSKCFKH